MKETIDPDKNKEKWDRLSEIQKEQQHQLRESARFVLVDRWQGEGEHKDVYLCIDCSLRYRVEPKEDKR